ncbi:MAG TPA: hypothetical protein VFS43_16265 [Polyangiaceae bacterium]|nr:hypothetical protein [Polyangiaceae bacterium]
MAAIATATPTAAPPAAPPAARPIVPAVGDVRSQMVLERLARGDAPAGGRGAPPFRRGARAHLTPWDLDRAIWRAGDLGLRAAEPLLLALPSHDKLRAYTLAWALARCGGEASVPFLRRLVDDRGRADATRVVATEALVRAGGAAERARVRAALLAELPPPLRAAVEKGDPAELRAQANVHWTARGDAAVARDFPTLYRLGDDEAHAVVLEYVSRAPLKPPHFKGLRRIFKLAELRRDAPIFGALARAFEKEHAAPGVSQNSYVHGGGRRYARATPEDWAGSSPPGAFGPGTKLYLRRRAWRTLRRLGELGSDAYVPMAVGVLLAYEDADAVPERRTRSAHYGPFAPYLAFNQILYGGGRRVVLSPSGRAFSTRSAPQPRRGRGVAAPAAAEPSGREESFPELWSKKPEGLLHLLDESRCAPVHEFAARALRACRAFCDALDVEAVAMLLARPYAPTARLGLELARVRVARGEGGPSLWLSAALSVDAEARAEAQGWLDRGRERVAGDLDLLAALASAPHADTRAYARRLFAGLAFAPGVAERLFRRLFEDLATLPEAQAELARDLGDALVALAAGGRVRPSAEELRALFQHPSAEAQRAAWELSALASGALPPDDVLASLLDSKHESLRATGLRILSRAGDDEAARPALWLSLATSRHADLREGSAPLLARLAAARPAFGAAVAGGLVEAILRRKLPEGAGPHAARLLAEGLRPLLDRLPDELLWRLVRSRAGEANDLAVALMHGGRLSLEGLPVSELVDLADHDAVAVRQLAWSKAEADVARLRAEAAEAARMLDAKWDDTRAFAFRLFREHFAGAGLTLETLVAVADSPRPDVQAFGRELITRHFRDEDGPELLRRLAEHPAPGAQLFATNFLERYAAGRPDRVRELVPYFRTVFLQVNRGRVARRRALAFLRSEGLASEEVARLAVGPLASLSVSVSVEARAGAVEALAALGRAWPGLETGLRVVPPEARGARGAKAAPPEARGAPGAKAAPPEAR